MQMRYIVITAHINIVSADASQSKLHNNRKLTSRTRMTLTTHEILEKQATIYGTADIQHFLYEIRYLWSKICNACDILLSGRHDVNEVAHYILQILYKQTNKEVLRGSCQTSHIFAGTFCLR